MAATGTPPSPGSKSTSEVLDDELLAALDSMSEEATSSTSPSTSPTSLTTAVLAATSGYDAVTITGTSTTTTTSSTSTSTSTATATATATATTSPISTSSGTPPPVKAYPKYNHVQKVLCLANVPYMATRFSGNCKTIELQTLRAMCEFLIKPEVISMLGQWEVAWGPVCYETAVSVIADNTFCVLHSIDEPATYCVALCGTNPLSIYSWIFQDLNSSQVPWPFSSSSTGAMISKGTLSALQWIVRVTSTNFQPENSERTLLQFLENKTSALCAKGMKMNLIVTGHSLGGALSPAVALYLADMSRDWDPHGVCTIETMPFAGPTIGNTELVSYAESKLGRHMQCIRNYYDMVPHAWNRTLLAEIPSLYEPVIRSKNISLIISLWLKMSRADHKHLCSEQPWLRTTKPTVTRSFFAETSFQHLKAYFVALSCTEILPLMGPYMPVFNDLLNDPGDASLWATMKAALKLSRTHRS
ncbi:lipase class 3 [Pelomyxa schiedti]|nr:lipase class 3 [Pelomyxa schiedti]